MIRYSQSPDVPQRAGNDNVRAVLSASWPCVSVDVDEIADAADHHDASLASPLRRTASLDAMVGTSLRRIAQSKHLGERRPVAGAEAAEGVVATLEQNGIAATPVVRGALFGFGGEGQLFDTNIPGFLLKEARPNGYFDSMEIIRGGEVECFQAIHGADAARHISEDSFLIRKFPGVDVGTEGIVFTADDARNLLRQVAEMHDKGIVHGDITNAFSSLVKNVLFDLDTRTFYIVDFGNAVYFTEASKSSDDAIARYADEYGRVRDSILYMADLLDTPEADSV